MEMMKSPEHHPNFVSYDESSTPYLIDNLYGKNKVSSFPLTQWRILIRVCVCDLSSLAVDLFCRFPPRKERSLKL